MLYRNFASLVFVLFLSLTSFAQNRTLRIESFTHDPMDQAAKNFPMRDGSGNLRALVKVRPANKDLKFEFGFMSSVVDTKEHDGETWVYVQKNARTISITGEGYESLLNEDLKMTLEEGQTYVLQLSVEQPKKTTQTLTIKYSPENAIILVDGNLKTGKNGIIIMEIPFGTHNYNAVAEGYVPQKGNIDLDEQNPGKLVIELDKDGQQAGEQDAKREKPDYNEIWYTTADGTVLEPKRYCFGANIISNTYDNGKGVIKFDGKVTMVGNYAFKDCSKLTTITIPDSVTSIGKGACLWCSNLISITIPNSVTDIGQGAFSGCSNLTSITIPNSVTSIGEYAFSYCKSLTSVRCEAQKLPEQGYLGSVKKAILYVPASSVNIYKEADGWKKFKEIRAIE